MMSRILNEVLLMYENKRQKNQPQCNVHLKINVSRTTKCFKNVEVADVNAFLDANSQKGIAY